MAMNEQNRYRTGGGFGGAFSTTMSGGQPPGRKKASASPGGISLRGGNTGGTSNQMRPDARGTQAARLRQRQNQAQAPGSGGVDWARVSGIPQGIDSMKNAYDKGGIGYMVGSEFMRGAGNAVDSIVQATAPLGRAMTDFGTGVYQGVTGQEPTPTTESPAPGTPAAAPTPAPVAPTPEAPAAAASPAQTQAEMLAEQSDGIGGAVEAGRMGPQGISQGAMLEAQTPGGKLPPEEVAPGVFRDDSPGPGMGAASYSDSAAGTAEGAFTNTGTMGIPRDGGVAHASNFGPFGRTPDEQTAIENRVGEIQRATDFIRSMRDVPTELDRMKQAAGANVSLNQGIGGFLQAGANRNYARDRVKEMEALGVKEKELATDASQQAFDNNIDLANLQKGVFDATYTEDSDGNRIPIAMNTATGEMLGQQAGAAPVTPEMMREEATKEVDAALEASPWWQPEGSVLKGKTREQAIEEAFQKRATPQQGKDQQLSPRGNPTQQAKGPDGKMVTLELVNNKWVPMK